MSLSNTFNLDFMTADESLTYFTHVDSEDKATHFTHPLFVSGDYTGCAVQAANRKVLLEDTTLVERLGIEHITESFSTESLIFPIAALKDAELIEIFNALQDYPSLNDEAIGEIETELELDCWESFGRRDFKEHLRIKLDDIFSEQIEDLTTEQLDKIYFSAASKTNYNVFEVESGTSGNFDFDRFGGIDTKSLELFKATLLEMQVSHD